MDIGSKDCIIRLQKILKGLGIKFFHPRKAYHLRATLSPKPGVRYTVFFESYSGRLQIEAPVFKSVSGEYRKVKLFLETLLTYNAAIYPFSFARVQTGRDSTQLILRYTPDCGTISAYEIKTAIECLNEVFVYHIPKLRDLALEYNLKFTGQDEFNVSELVKNIIGI